MIIVNRKKVSHFVLLSKQFRCYVQAYMLIGKAHLIDFHWGILVIEKQPPFQ